MTEPHPKVKPFLDHLLRINELVKSFPDWFPEFNLYPDPMNDWEIEWFHDPDNAVIISPLRDQVLYGVIVNGVYRSGEFKFGDVLPTDLTTAIKDFKDRYCN